MGAASSSLKPQNDGSTTSSTSSQPPNLRIRDAASHAPRSELAERVYQCMRLLQRAPFEPTPFSLECTPATVESPLAVRMVSSRAVFATDVDLVVPQRWWSPFRLVLVVVRLPVEYSALESNDMGVAIQHLISNMALEATLQVPSTSTTHGTGRAPAPLIQKLHTVMRDCSCYPLFGRCVLIEIPVQADVTLRPGAAITLSVSVAGFPIGLRIPAGHIHSAACNHKKKGRGNVWWAAREGNAAALEAALAAGGSTEEADKEHGTALCTAAYLGHTEAVRILLASGADVNAKGQDMGGRAPLHWAAVMGHLPVVQALLVDPRVNAGQKDEDGTTPLHVAAMIGHLPVARALLGDPRVDPWERDNEGRTPLHWAAARGYLHVVQALLLDPRINPGEKDWSGHTPLHEAARGNNVHVVQALLRDPRVNPWEIAEDGHAPVDCAREHGCHPSVVEALEAHARLASP